jgi:hypothetical protein
MRRKRGAEQKETSLEDFRDEKGFLDKERFGFKNGDEVWANLSPTEGHPIWVKGILNGMLVHAGGEPLTEENVTINVEFKWRGKPQVTTVYRGQLRHDDPHTKDAENQLSMF